MVGTHRIVLKQLCAATNKGCQGITDVGKVSGTKSHCTASTRKLGKEIQIELQDYGIMCQDRVCSLGSAMGAGR